MRFTRALTFPHFFRNIAQSLIQVAGRAGRANHPGEVLIQTHQPHHPLLKTLIEKNYLAFADALLQERQLARLFPFSFLALLKLSGKNKTLMLDKLETVKHELQTHRKDLQIFGPVAARMEKKAGYYRYQLIFQSQHRHALKTTLSQLMTLIEKNKKPSTIKWMIDVDPIEIE